MCRLTSRIVVVLVVAMATLLFGIAATQTPSASEIDALNARVKKLEDLIEKVNIVEGVNVDADGAKRIWYGRKIDDHREYSLELPIEKDGVPRWFKWGPGVGSTRGVVREEQFVVTRPPKGTPPVWPDDLENRLAAEAKQVKDNIAKGIDERVKTFESKINNLQDKIKTLEGKIKDAEHAKNEKASDYFAMDNIEHLPHDTITVRGKNTHAKRTIVAHVWLNGVQFDKTLPPNSGLTVFCENQPRIKDGRMELTFGAEWTD